MVLRPRRAAFVGYVGGFLFFALDCTWLGETAGALIAPFGFVFDLVPALIEATAFGVTAYVVALATQRLHPLAVPFVAAATFTATEWIRSIGVMGAPLYMIGSPFVQTKLAPLAAFAGNAGITFAITLIAATLALLAIERSRAAIALCLGSIALVALCASVAWYAWPARTLGSATIRVAAVQGNFMQDVKWKPGALERAVERYTSMTLALRAFKPQFVLWPETVITTRLSYDPTLQAGFARLARSLNTTLAVGSIEDSGAAYYNSLFFYDHGGNMIRTYRKRQLVPFVEFLPGPHWLRALPGAKLVSDFGIGDDATPIDSTLHIAPLICWESAFGDLAQTQSAAGASIFAIATDDAWFGMSDGPYWHAQIASLRAIETGRWIVRAAATGISGIIAPDGSWHGRSELGTQETITGYVGAPQPTFFSRVGPTPLGLLASALALGLFYFARKKLA